MDLSLFLPPLAACLVIVAIHSYLGLHVIAREVIFVDLSLAQMAALGSTVAILAGSRSDSTSAFVYALGFTALGAAVFALTRTDEKGRVPQEAIIGIVFVMASAAAILVADPTPRGGEAIKNILVGSLLWVTWPAIARLAGVYVVIGLFHWVLRRRRSPRPPGCGFPSITTCRPGRSWCVCSACWSRHQSSPKRRCPLQE